MTFISTPGTSGVSDPNTVRKLLAPDPDTVCAPATGATSTRPTSTLAAIARNRATWRMLPILASLAWLAWGGLAPARAAAHTCVTPVEVDRRPAGHRHRRRGGRGRHARGRPSTSRSPRGSPSTASCPPASWQGTLDGDVLSLRGGQIAGGACGFLLVKGTATQGGHAAPPDADDRPGWHRPHLDRPSRSTRLSAMVVEAQAAGRARRRRGVGRGGRGPRWPGGDGRGGRGGPRPAVRRGPIREAGPDGTQGNAPSSIRPARAEALTPPGRPPPGSPASRQPPLTLRYHRY